jgi:hypothetical protein
MSDDADWVLLVECTTTAELNVLRATLEARGVPCRVHGEHTHGVLGPIQGAVARPRVLVPRRALSLARTLAEDIVGPFDERPEDDDDAPDASPFRTSAERADEDEDERDGDDAASTDEPSALAEKRGSARPLRPRSYAGLFLVLLTGGAFFGLGHLYVRRNVRAGILASVSVFSIAACTQGAMWAVNVPIVVALVDLVGGILGVREDRRRHAALASAPEPELPEPELPEPELPEPELPEHRSD